MQSRLDIFQVSFYLRHGAIVIELPVEVKVFNADAAGVRAGQHDGASIHRLQEGNLPHKHLQTLSRPHIWGRGATDYSTLPSIASLWGKHEAKIVKQFESKESTVIFDVNVVLSILFIFIKWPHLIKGIDENFQNEVVCTTSE